MKVKVSVKLLCLIVLAVSGVAVMAQVTGTTMLTVGSGGSSSAIFSDGFESGSFSAWTAVGGGTWTYNCIASSGAGTGCGSRIVTSPVHSGTYAAEQHYQISSSLSGNQESDLAISYPNPKGLTHFFLRGWVYFHNNGTATNGNSIARKLVYIKANDSSGRQTYNFVLTSWASDGSGMDLAVEPHSPTIINQWYGLGHIPWESWHEVEIEVNFGTPGNSDGYWNIWLDGKKTGGVSGLTLRDAGYTNLPNEIDIGNQVDVLAGGISVDEFRYWDDLAFNDSFIP
jgi:hypothetical protein